MPSASWRASSSASRTAATLPKWLDEGGGALLADGLGKGEGLELLLGEVVDVGDVAHEALAEENVGKALAQALDVHGAARGEVLDEADLLLRAGEIGAVGVGGVLLALDGRVAGGAGRRHGEDALAAVAQAHDRRDHLGDDIARALDDDRVADADVLAVDVLLVVERRHLDARPADDDRLEHGEGVERARAAHVDGDVEELRRALLGRELEGDGPAGLAPDDAEPVPLFGVVDLDDDAVDVVVEALAALPPPGHAPGNLVEVGVALRVGVDGEAEGGEPLEPLDLARGERPLAPADLVDVEGERPLGGDGRIELADGAGGGVAGVGEERFAPLGALGVHALEAALRHVDLAAHLEGRGKVARQGEGDGADRAQVGRDVLAAAAVPARGALHEASPLVGEGDGEAVDLRLRREGEVVASRAFGGAAVPVGQVLGAAGVAEAEEGGAVLDRGERLEGGGADALGGGVGGDELGEGFFQPAQLVQELVVLAVADLGRVEHVVAVVVVIDVRPQLFAAESRLVLGVSHPAIDLNAREAGGGARARPG